jgi:hypothetical protein
MAETPRPVIRRPDGQPYSPGSITKTVYVLKSTDQWLPDEGPDGAIWSGGHGIVKLNQHPARYILDTDGAVLRLPLSGGEDPSVLAGPERRLDSTAETERREQLIECAEAVSKLARHRNIEPVPALLVRHDRDIRPVLDTIVRRWTLLTRPKRVISTAAAKMRGATRHREHVVPCRVLVDRMIMNPSECRELLETAVIIADVTPAEHIQLGGIYAHHKDLYGRMLKAPVSQLPSLGWERYAAKEIEVKPES